MQRSWIKRIIVLATLVAIAAGLAWAMRDPPQPVDLAELSRGELLVVVEEEGRTRVRDLYAVTSPIAGRLDRLALEEGDPVTGGQSVIASIKPLDPPFLDARTRQERLAALEAARAEVSLARVDYQRARTAQTLARSELTRTRELAARQLVSASTLEKAESEAALQNALVESAQAGIRVADARLTSAQAMLTQPGQADTPTAETDCCVRVVAPADGVILSVLVRSAQPVSQGTKLAEIGDPSRLELVVELLSADATRVRPGAQVRIHGWGGERMIHGTVQRIEPAGFTKVSALGIEEQRVITVIDLPDPPAALGHGYHALASIEIERHPDVLRVPIGALFRVAGQWSVFVDEQGHARERRLELGAINAEHAEVRQGLSAGDRVVMYPSDLIADGVAIAPR
ncbi:MAG: HlyD family efflux transporter periplasmic adaptor subunit [Burkholderiaceae bacterium]